LANAPWETVYLQTAHAYKREPELQRLIDKVANAAWDAAVADNAAAGAAAAAAAAKARGGPSLGLSIGPPPAGPPPAGPGLSGLGAAVAGLRRDALELRVVELHTVEPGGALPNPEHFDGGSVLTVGKTKTKNVQIRRFRSKWPSCRQWDSSLIFCQHRTRHALKCLCVS
jgi:hypothetical protein